ncbi:MAG: hypothetical protein ACRDO7_12980, partial [Nocardioidaceae bacterium]
FDTALEERVEKLVECAAIPVDLRYSDTGEWFAAAIVAAGKASYQQALQARRPLDVDDWSFEEAEDLLVVAESILDPAEIELAVDVEWLCPVFPEDAEPPEDPVVGEFDDLGPEWGVPAVEDRKLADACEDIVRAPSWRSWFEAQPSRPGTVAVAVEDEVPTGLTQDGRPQSPHYRYVVPSDRLLEADDRRVEMRGVLVEAWRAIADSVGWEPPPADPGDR